MSLASITEWEMYITAQGPRLLNDLNVSSGTLNSSIPYHQETWPKCSLSLSLSFSVLTAIFLVDLG